jgi:hypothetical protein
VQQQLSLSLLCINRELAVAAPPLLAGPTIS